jgi:hypothetical protein
MASNDQGITPGREAWCSWDKDKPEGYLEYFFSSRAGLMMKVRMPGILDSSRRFLELTQIVLHIALFRPRKSRAHRLTAR